MILEINIANVKSHQVFCSPFRNATVFERSDILKPIKKIWNKGWNRSFPQMWSVTLANPNPRRSVLLLYFLGYRRSHISMNVLLRVQRSSAACVIGRKIAYFAIGATVIRKYANAITASVRARLFYEVEKSMNALSWEIPLLQFERIRTYEREDEGLLSTKEFELYATLFLIIYFYIRFLLILIKSYYFCK